MYEQLKFCLYQDDAVTGEAAGIVIGICEFGSKCAEAIEAMVAYAQETQHEKILRGLAVGIALVMYGRLEEADPVITSLMNDKDAILRHVHHPHGLRWHWQQCRHQVMLAPDWPNVN